MRGLFVVSALACIPAFATGAGAAEREYDPDRRNTAVYDELSTQFVKAFKATQPIIHSLNRPQSA